VNVINISNVNTRNITASGGYLAIAGAGIHLVVATMKRGDVWRQIRDEGFVNTVTLDPSADQLAAAEAFWFSPGSFAVPLGLIGLLVVHLTRKGQRLPLWLGWIIVVWALILGLLVPNSGAWLILAVGALIVVGESRHARHSERAAVSA
jgi:Family of unknown function (DUF6463)